MASKISVQINDDNEDDSDKEDEDYVPGENEGHELSEEENSGDEEFDNQINKNKKKNDEPKKILETSEEEDKKRIDNLWADFTKGVSQPEGKTSKSLSSTQLSNNTVSTSFDKPCSLSTTETSETVPKKFVSSHSESKKGIQDTTPKSSSSEPLETSKLKVSQTFDFAGESIEIVKEFDKDSKEGRKVVQSQENGKRGLSSLLGIISGKKPKLGCLDKTKMDWNSFVQEEGIRDELSTYNRGKDGYVEKQLFLERTDIRRFEAEKAARDKTRRSRLQ